MMLLILFVLCLINGFYPASSLDLTGVVSGNRMGGVPLGRSLGNGELDVEGVCTSQGVTCQNCSHAVTCVALPVGWLKIPLHECPEGETCNSHRGGCSKEPVPECQVASLKYEHICEQVGIFPDAFDCRKFHLCSPPSEFPHGRPAEHRSALCPRHYAYNALTAQCSIYLPKGQCETKPVHDCTTIGATGALPGSPNHFYICLSKYDYLYPQIFLCPNGWFFWDGYCRPEPSPTTTSTPTTVQNDVTTTPVADKINSEYNSLSFFSTEKSTTFAADTFLADKFDLSKYEAMDSSIQTFGSYEALDNSFETGFGTID